MQQFDKVHQDAFGEESKAPGGGLPDDGNGYFASKLSYADWYNFNNAVRSHMNFLETAVPIVIMAGITSLYQPLWAFICMVCLALGRFLYVLGYQIKGPKGRIPGAMLGMLGFLGVFIGSIVSIASWDTSGNEPRLLPYSTDQYGKIMLRQN